MPLPSPGSQVDLATLLAGEDTTVGVIKVEERFGYTNVTASGTGAGGTAIKNSAGFLHLVVLNSAPTAANTITLLDGTSSAATATAATISVATTLVSPVSVLYDVNFVNGIFITQTVAENITLSWR